MLAATYELKSILHSIDFSNWRSSARIFEFTRFLGHFAYPLRNLLANKKEKTLHIVDIFTLKIKIYWEKTNL